MKKLISTALALLLLLSLSTTALAAAADDVSTLTVDTATASAVSFTGTAGSNVLAVAVEIVDGGGSVALKSFAVESAAFSGSFTGLSLTAGATYTLRAANYNGGSWTTTTFTVPVPPAPPASPGTSSNTYTIPVENGTGSVSASATVYGGTATVTVSNVQLDTVLNDAATEGNIVINAGLDRNIDSVTINTSVLESISDAANDEHKAITGLDVVTDTGKISLDAAALGTLAEQAKGSTVTIHVEEIAQTGLTAAQRESLTGDYANAAVIEVTAASGGTAITDFGGGTIAVTVPYTLKDGESPAGICVWHLASDGTLTLMKCSYDPIANTVSFVTDHLSDFIVCYDAVAAFVNPFTDVAENDWFYDDVAYAYVNGLMQGTSDTTFDPHGVTSRGVIVTVLYRLEGEPAVAGSCPFDDVASGKYYENAVTWAAANNIVEGYGNAKFGPDDSITREQMAAILYHYEQYKGGGFAGSWYFPLNYPDAAEVSDWADEAMHWCVMNGIIQGSDGKLLPDGNAERCQAAAILHRFCESISE